MPFAVAEKVGGVQVVDGMTCIDGENTIIFAFANTLDSNAVPAVLDPACWGVTCPAGSNCSNGFCLCSSGQEVCGEICCPDGQMCSSRFAGCVEATGCLSNADCNEGEYCLISATKDMSETTCYKDYNGVCMTLTDGTETEIEGVGTVFRSNVEVGSWWAAKNWCQAHGKRLMRISNNRLGCYRESDGTTPFGETTTGYCCAENQAGCSDDKTKQSILMQELRNKLSDGTVWLETDFSSCVASYMLLSIGGIGNSSRGYNDYALCEETTASGL